MRTRQVLRRLPLTFKTVGLTVIIGAVVGAGTLTYVDRMVRHMFNKQLASHLAEQATEDRIRFDRYIANFRQVALVTVGQKSFLDYIEARGCLLEGEDKILTTSGLPAWAPGRSTMRALATPRHIILFDKESRWREAYSSGGRPPPDEIMMPEPLLLEKSTGQTHIVTIADIPYLITSARVSATGCPVRMLIASPIDERLLLATQGNMPQRTVGLISGSMDTVLASSNSDIIPPGSRLDELRENFVVAGREFHDYGGAEMIIRISSFVSNEEVRKMAGAFVLQERWKALVISGMFILSFTGLMLWVTRRIGRLAGDVEGFAVGALGGNARHLPPGDQIDILAESFTLLRQEVTDSHRKIREEVEDRTTRQLTIERQEKMLSLLRSVTEALEVGVMISRKGDLSPLNNVMIRYIEDIRDITVFEVSSSRIEELTVIDKNGIERTFEVSCPLNINEGRALLVREVTDEKLAEAERERLRTNLAHSQRLESIGRLAGGVAHDFNNILTAINGYAELLKMDLPGEGPAQERLDMIISSGERAAELTKQLLGFSRKQAIRPLSLNLGQSIKSLSRMLRRLLGEDVVLTLRSDEDLWNIFMDPTQVEQVIFNLAINSRDAMSDGGLLTIELRNAPREDNSFSRNGRTGRKDYVRLSVTDTGVGMEKEVQEQIFEPFFTTKETGKGTGLGLAMVYGVVQQNDGAIQVRSRAGEGTTFDIYLPRHFETAAASTTPVKGKDTIQGGSDTILLVEDQEEVRTLARRMLSNLGYEVLEAENGGRALEVFSQNRNRVCLLLTDVAMPGLKGPELADHVRRLNPEMKVLFMTGYAEDDVKLNGGDRAPPIVQKPLSFQGLARAVRNAIDDP